MILEKVFRRLLLLFPPRFRAEFEEEMVDFFRDRMREARRRGWIATVVAALGALVDLLWSSARERLDSRAKNAHVRRRRGAMLETLGFDLKGAASALRRRPGVSLAVVSTLALGIAANTAVFAVVDAVLLRPFPYPEPERIVTLWNRYDTSRTSSSPPDYMDRRRESRLLESIAAFRSVSMNLAQEGGARRVEASRVTSEFFRVMRVEPAAGAARFADESSGNVERVAVLGFGLWQSAFGGDPEVLGRTIRLDGESWIVTGVMPESFDYPPATEVFLPLVFAPDEMADSYRGNEYLTVTGRMKPGVELSDLEREMNAIAASVLERVPERRDFLERNGWGASVVPLQEQLAGKSRSVLIMLSTAVLVVLLATGANVAHVLLSSGNARRGELAIRASLGATRPRLFGQLLTESMLLSLTGGLAGLVLSFFLVRALPSLLPGDFPLVERIAFDLRAGGFTLLVAVAMGFFCGALPGWQASASELRSPSRSTAAGGARRLRGGLVVSEVALALVLLIAAGLLLRSFSRISSRSPGFDPRGRLSLEIDFPSALISDPEDRGAAVRELLERLRALPGVRSAAASERLPLDGSRWTGTFHPEGYVPARGEPVPGADFNRVTPGYLAALGIPLLRGRDFPPEDSERLLLVDERTEATFWPEGAVGRRINFARPSQPPNLFEIVGVVGRVSYESLDEPGRFQIYFGGRKQLSRHLKLTLRSDADPALLSPLVREEVEHLSPDLAVHSLRTLESRVRDSLALRELQTGLVGVFALLVLALAGVGIYGVLSYSVTQRTAEVGIRMALGASGGSVLGLILKEGLFLAGFGIALGWIGAAFVSGVFSRFLYGVAATDGTTYLASTVVLALVAVSAALVPALKASRTDPLLALRRE